MTKKNGKKEGTPPLLSAIAGVTVWRSNYPTVSEFAEKVKDVLEDQVRRGHTEQELCPGLVIAPLGRTRKRRATGHPLHGYFMMDPVQYLSTESETGEVSNGLQPWRGI